MLLPFRRALLLDAVDASSSASSLATTAPGPYKDTVSVAERWRGARQQPTSRAYSLRMVRVEPREIGKPPVAVMAALVDVALGEVIALASTSRKILLRCEIARRSVKRQQPRD